MGTAVSLDYLTEKYNGTASTVAVQKRTDCRAVFGTLTWRNLVDQPESMHTMTAGRLGTALCAD